MFGYVKPLECELKVREQTLYQAYYCGLCKTLGRRYGFPARLLLSYDCAFMACLFSEMGGVAAGKVCRCIRHPLRRKRLYVEENEALIYAADVNVLLGIEKLADDWRDEKKLLARLSFFLLKKAYRKAKEYRPALHQATAEHLRRLFEAERAKTSCTDEPSDAFGALMRDIVLLSPGLQAENRTACAWMFYNLGRWIYLIDAWEDRPRDQKKGAYNPFLAAGMKQEEAAFVLYTSLGEAEKAYDLIDFPSEHGISENIVCLGCRQFTRILLTKEKSNEPL